MSIKTKLGLNDGIKSTRAFMTSVTPVGRSSEEPNLGFTSAELSPIQSNKFAGSGRKIFGAQAYLERKKKLSEARHSEAPPDNPPLQKSEFDNEFNAMHTNMAESRNKK